MKTNNAKNCISSQRIAGFSLMEVLVAVFVLAVGVVSVAGLQVTAKRANFEAIQRSTATQLATEMIERMRANSTQLMTYNANGGGMSLTGTTLTAPPDCEAAACTPQQLANYDMSEFERALLGVAEQNGANNVGGLTLPIACITGPAPLAGPSAAPGNYTVTIAWRGLSRLTSPAAVSNCGFDPGVITQYDDPDSGAQDVFRRVLVMTTFIDVQ
jgi:type IV pilus assembly protein PilV